ncbi:MAG: hypothetical protein EI684_17500 [Candidatus Viridilinea halotolerans]|uniref:Peptidase MA-like domain-containing protein n=1 Tax=Candidatus Viridilinea halotolerans TaxID=2491704 RepID=A0A426TU08_9CHLR|nr:MAG: hypothetical protein EI684_17500 [Candidatus Viridilinea halotolerans]
MAFLKPLSLSALLLLLIWFLVAERPTTSRFMPHETTRPLLSSASGAAPLRANYTVRANDHLILSSAADLFVSEQQDRLHADLQQALTYVSGRFGNTAQGTISIYVGNERSCGLHGIAYTELRTVQVFTCPSLPLERTVSIAAHEFVHQLCHDHYGAAHLQADLILMEGIATWGAGSYWLGSAPNFRSFVRPWVAQATDLPLATSYVGRPISDMNQLYYQWASFVEFLIEQEGRERFDMLYLSGHNAPGSADYLAVYGRDLATLEAEWRAWVLGG